MRLVEILFTHINVKRQKDSKEMELNILMEIREI